MTNIPKIVLSRLQSQAADPHPDADLLTAFAEQSLNGRERDHVVEHIARCGDCREVVALTLPANEEMVVVRPGRSAAGWLSWPVVRWGLITAGILAVTSVGVVQYQRRQEPRLVATSRQPDEPLRAAENASSPSPTVPAPTETRQVAATQGKKQSTTSNALPTVKAQTDTNAFPIAPRSLQRSGTTSLGGPLTATFGGRIAAAEQAPSQSEATSAEASSDQMVRVRRAKPAAAQTSALPMAPSPLLHIEPSVRKGVTPRWSIGNSGTLQRSADGGRTWNDVNVTVDSSMSSSMVPSNRAAEAGKTMVGKAAGTTVEVSGSVPSVDTDEKSEGTVESGSAETSSAPQSPAKARLSYVLPNASGGTIFRALAVSSDLEVWAGGSGGALYHTLDAGSRWFRVVPSDGGGVLTGDIVGIQFSDAQNGTVRTSTGETWTTLDDGQAWHKQP